MKAAVFHKAGEIAYDTMPDPKIELAMDVIAGLIIHVNGVEVVNG